MPIGDVPIPEILLRHLHEEQPLGTAGPLRALRGTLSDGFFVLNGNLLSAYRALAGQWAGRRL